MKSKKHPYISEVVQNYWQARLLKESEEIYHFELASFTLVISSAIIGTLIIACAEMQSEDRGEKLL